MTVSNQDNRISAFGTGAEQTVPFTFPIVNNGDITVTQRVTDTGAETPLTETTNYTMTNNGSLGGSITTVTPFVASTAEIYIVRNTPMTQLLDLEQGGSFNAENIEAAFDKNTKLIIENSDSVGRSLQLPITDSASLDMTLPNSVARASKALTFDSNGEPDATAAATTTVAFSSLGEDLVADDTEAKMRNTIGFDDADKYASFAAAITAIGSTETTLWIHSAQVVSTSPTVPETCTLRFTRGGQLNIATGQTVTIEGAIEAGNYQIFSLTGTGVVAIARGIPIGKAPVHWWGAKGDAATDDTTAIQNALDAATDVFLPQGRYKTTSALNVKKTVNLSGVGWQSILQPVDCNALEMIGADQVGGFAFRSHVKDLQISMTNAQDYLGIEIDTAYSIVIDTVRATDCGAGGISINTCNNMTIKDCLFGGGVTPKVGNGIAISESSVSVYNVDTTNWNKGIYIIDGAQGVAVHGGYSEVCNFHVHIADAANNLIAGRYMTAPTSHLCVYLKSVADGTCYSNTILSCHIANDGDNAVTIGTDAYNTSVINCYMNGFVQRDNCFYPVLVQNCGTGDDGIITTEMLLNRRAVNLQNGDAATNVLWIPTNSKAIITKVVIHSPSGSLAGGTDFDIGSATNRDTWKQAVNLSTMTATTDYMVITSENTKYTLEPAEARFGIKPITGATADVTATMDVYGYLIQG